MTFSRNIGRNLNPVRQTYTSHLTQCRIRLFGRSCINTGTNTTLLRAILQRRRSCLTYLTFSTFSYQLLYCWHCSIYLVIAIESRACKYRERYHTNANYFPYLFNEFSIIRLDYTFTQKSSLQDPFLLINRYITI